MPGQAETPPSDTEQALIPDNGVTDDGDLGWWSWTHRATGKTNFVPGADVRTHFWGMACWCRPEVSDLGWVVHNSADGREAREAGRLRPH